MFEFIDGDDVSVECEDDEVDEFDEEFDDDENGVEV